MATELNMRFDDGELIVSDFTMANFLCGKTRRLVNEYCANELIGATEHFAMQGAVQASSTTWSRLYDYPTTLVWKRSYITELSKLHDFKLGEGELLLLKDCYNHSDVSMVAMNMRAIVYHIATGNLKIDCSDLSAAVVTGAGIHWVINPLKCNLRDRNKQSISNLEVRRTLLKLLD